jgi:endonuclease/exonuclease/phosphatase (EEP) superfamily protein YafD
MRLRWGILAALVTTLLLPAVTVTAARVLNPTAGPWVRLVAFTPYALLLYLGALLVLVVASQRVRGTWRSTTRALALAALVGVAVHGWWASTPFVATRPVSKGAPLHVMTSNLLFGGADCGRVLRIALDHGVDVLVLEEVTPRALARLRTAGIDDAFPHQAGAPASDTSGTMVFSSSPLTRVRRLATGFGSYAMDVQIPRVHAGVVHLLAVHPRAPVGDAEAWASDQRVIRRAAHRHQGPTMLLGDLNATMDHAPMRDLVALGYRDAATEAGSRWQPTWPSAGEVSVLGVPLPPLVAIDHVLITGGLRPVGTWTFRVQGTDHRALVAAVDL